MIYRIDVRRRQRTGTGSVFDAVGEALRRQIQEFSPSVGGLRAERIFLIDTDTDAASLRRAANELLADPLEEEAELVDTSATEETKNGAADGADVSRIEIHLKPGVMDPVAASTELALRAMGVPVREVRTGRAYLLTGGVSRAALEQIAQRVLANGVIESVHFERYTPKTFATGREEPFRLRHVELLKCDAPALAKLSRDGHLFLSPAEMAAVQAYFRQQRREPTDVELETIAQTWSEHCVHKTLKSAVDVEVRDGSGAVIARRRYGNLIKETIFQSTAQLMARLEKRGFCLSVFSDNAGVIAFDETDGVCFKVETHNHPSAIEPYGGAATGAGGVIRDILGTGLGAKPIANTDVFCVADPNFGRPSALLPTKHPQPTTHLPKGLIHPRRVLEQVVAGVRDYGNRMGIPTVNGAVYFDNRYLGNPLVFCGCVGLIPRNKLAKAAQSGDAIVVMGGRTGRDGIHGATFSSAELTDTHADEFSHAVQIGNAITEKKVADVILAARDAGLFTGVTDCGAGGLSSAVGEMGEKVGAEVHLDRVPLKYAGLRYDEIWISEAQERMVLSVPQQHVAALQKLAADEDVETSVIGTFGTPGRELVLHFRGQEVGRLGMAFLHDGIPMPTRKAVVIEQPSSSDPQSAIQNPQPDFRSLLLAALAHPNIASKHWIIRQYDHEVQGGSVIKPLIGPLQRGPSDAAVVRPKLGSHRGVAIGAGLAPQIADPYAMAIAAIDEAIRNVVCVGADYNQIAILDNFCWPSCDDELTMGTLVRAAEACRDAALAYGVPFISGKDSLHNQFTNSETGEVIRIPATLLISAMGIVPDVRRCVTMDFKVPGARLWFITTNDPTNLSALAATHRCVAHMIAAGQVAAVHDVSDGGVLVAAAEMAIASGYGAALNTAMLDDHAFQEMPGAYLMELRHEGFNPRLMEKVFPRTTTITNAGTVRQETSLVKIEQKLTRADVEEMGAIASVEELTAAWRGTLDW
jgi:phosphoribosylformylglycinamidine synthase II